MSDRLNDEATIRAMVKERVAEETAPAAAGAAGGSGGGGGNGDGKGGGLPPLPKPTPEFVLQCLRANELGDGILFAYLFRNRHVYVGQAEEWMYWSGHHWNVDLVDKAHRASADVEHVALAYESAAGHYAKQAKEAREEGDKDAGTRYDRYAADMRKRAFRLRSQSGRMRCLDFAKANHDCPLSIGSEVIDRDPWKLPVANGVIDLRTGELHPGRPADYLMKASPVVWEGINAPCPAWERFVLEIMDNDPEMAAFLQRVFGYGITGCSTEHIFLMLFGRGRNGKSLFCDIVQAALGGQDATASLAGPVQSEMLLDQGKRSAAGPSPDIMSLRGMRLAFASETDEGQRFSSARVKWLSGGDLLTGRYPHDKRNVSFDPTHLLVLLTNNKPRANPNDFAFWERLMLVDFPLSFVDREPQKPTERPMDKGLKEKLLAELPGVLAWLVRGCLLWQQAGGFKPPEKVRAATAEYQRAEDNMAEFLDDCCIMVPPGDDPRSVRTKSTEIFDAFNLWFRVNVTSRPGKGISQKRFGQLMGEKFERERKGGVYYYYGVELNGDAIEELRAREADDAGK